MENSLLRRNSPGRVAFGRSREIMRKSTYLKVINFVIKGRNSKVIWLCLAQSSIGALDLIGIGLLGILISISLNTTGDFSNAFPDFLPKIFVLNGMGKNDLLVTLSILTSTVLIGKTFFSLYFTKKILLYFSNLGTSITSSLFEKMLVKPFAKLVSKPTQELTFGLTRGVELITLGVAGVSLVLISDIVLLLILTIFLFVLSPGITLGAIVFFGVTGFILNALLSGRSGKLGRKNSELDIKSMESVFAAISMYREIHTRDQRSLFVLKFKSLRDEYSRTSAHLTYLPFISKYYLEASMVLAIMSLASLTIFVGSAFFSFAVLGVFVGAATRIVPAILRIQQGLMQIKVSLNRAEPTIDLIGFLEAETSPLPLSSKKARVNNPVISLVNVNYKYANENSFGMRNINLEVNLGEFIGIAGTSGSGKTTLADLIIGIAQPNSGRVELYGKAPNDTLKLMRGRIGYVPQETFIANATIYENITLGYSELDFKIDDLDHAIKAANLEEFIRDAPQGLQTIIGEHGFGMSGGQKQRLGIARALIGNPEVIILDEATSNLDSESEFEVMKLIKSLKGKCTLVVIAHRLSTILEADRVVYMDRGCIEAVGSFEEVKNISASFEAQAKLLGL